MPGLGHFPNPRVLNEPSVLSASVVREARARVKSLISSKLWLAISAFSTCLFVVWTRDMRAYEHRPHPSCSCPVLSCFYNLSRSTSNRYRSFNMVLSLLPLLLLLLGLGTRPRPAAGAAQAGCLRHADYDTSISSSRTADPTVVQLCPERRVTACRVTITFTDPTRSFRRLGILRDLSVPRCA